MKFYFNIFHSERMYRVYLKDNKKYTIEAP